MWPTQQPIHRTSDIRALEHTAGPDADLMEHAGRAAAHEACELLGSRAGAVLVMCGPGNNGGDGFVMARCLLEAGRAVTVLFAASAERLPPDAARAHARFLQAGGTTTAHWPQAPQALWALAVDALFGIGLTRAIDAPYADWIHGFNALPCPRLALDTPSGLNADTGALTGPAVRATLTLTFIALKSGLLTLDGPDHAGEVRVASFGLDARAPPPGWVNGPAHFSSHLTHRPRNAHKGCFGNVAVVGGAPGMTGAALICGRAALYTGAGRVLVGTLDPALSLDPLQPELMVRDWQDACTLADVLAVGPGLGQCATARVALEAAVRSNKPLVLDADALNLLAAHPVLQSLLRRRSAATMLTPHPLEAARLLGCTALEVQADRMQSATKMAERFHAQVVLKGCGSVLASPQGPWFINPTGNPGMSSAGMGDALTGIAAAFLAQGFPANEAARAATFIHGAAADRCVQQGAGPVGLSATETIPAARAVLNTLIAAGVPA